MIKVNAGVLKIIAIISMVADHIAGSLLDPVLRMQGIISRDFLFGFADLSKAPGLCIASAALHLIGRVSFPLILFLLAEGFRHTQDIKKYLLRLGLMAVAAEIPYNLCFYGKCFVIDGAFPFSCLHNTGWTLTISLLAMLAMQRISRANVVVGKIFSRENMTGSKGMITPGASDSGGAWHPALDKVLSCLGPLVFCGTLSFYTASIYFPDFDIRTFPPAFTGIGTLLFLGVYFIVMRPFRGAVAKKIRMQLCTTGLLAFVSFLLGNDYAYIGVVGACVVYLILGDRLPEQSAGEMPPYRKSYTAGSLALCYWSLSELAAFLMLPLIRRYDGTAGRPLFRNPVLNRYFYYVFYPLHLLLLWGAAKLILH